jgi:putative thioredoxin
MEFFTLTVPAGAQPAVAPALAMLLEAVAAFQAGHLGEALDRCMESVQEDRDFGSQLARRGMVGLFTLLGEEHELTDDYRRRLAQALY